jgi:tripartite-type tricarboxylate transporter receptor subunit TctC
VKIIRRQFLKLTAGAAAVPAVSRVAWAQTYPTRPITMIVPFPPGGANDMLGRIIAERMRGILSQSIVIENIGGAAGSIGVGRAVCSPADGYTLNIGSVSSHVLSGAIYALPYDLVNDLEPGRPACVRTADDCRKEKHAGGGPEGIDRVVEGQTVQGITG